MKKLHSEAALKNEVNELRKKIASLTVPVKKTGKVSAKLVTIDINDFRQDESYKPVRSKTGSISKSSSQIDDASNLSAFTMKPYANRDAQKRFYEQNPYNYRSLKLISTCVAGIGHNIVPVDPTLKDYFDDSEYKKFRDFLDTPNQGDDLREATTFQEILVAGLNDKKNFGDGFFEIVRSHGGEVTEIYHMRAFNAYVKINSGKKYYIQKKGSKEKWFKPFGAKYGEGMPEVLNIRNYNPFSDYYGFPENYPATADMILDRFGTEYNIKRFQNNLMIQFMIICEGGEIDSGGLSKVTEFLRANYKGIQNAGKVLYLNSDDPDVKIRIEKLDSEVRDASFQKLHEKARDNTIVAHGILGRLVGIVTSGSMGGGGEATAQFNIFLETMIRPEQADLAKKLQPVFVAMGIKKFKLEFKELSIETFKELVEAYGNAFGKGLIDDNEARQGIDFTPRDKSETDLDIVLAKARKIVYELEQTL